MKNIWTRIICLVWGHDINNLGCYRCGSDAAWPRPRFARFKAWIKPCPICRKRFHAHTKRCEQDFPF